ncbi:MAG: hypothetical protein ACFFD2_13965 [Promethearchaeota archaeon]
MGFEPYSNDTAFHEYQLSLIVVNVGQKISHGDEVGSLLNGGEYPHIHYSLHSKKTGFENPYIYSSASTKLIFEEIAARTNSTIYYP